MKQSTKEYIAIVEHEIEELSSNFTGNIDFKFNFKEGSVASINIIKGKSFWIVKDK